MSNQFAATYSYRAYGLSFVSDTEVVGLHVEPSHTGSPDVALSMGSEPPSWVQQTLRQPGRNCYRNLSPGDADSRFTVTAFGTCFELTYGDGAQFFIDSKCQRVWCRCLSQRDLDDVGVYLRGPVTGFILRQRGVVSLHASAVSVAGRCALLCGESGSGKSTTAAALGLRGAPVLCDDIAAITQNGLDLYVESGYPRICLWPDSVMHLFKSCDALPKLTPSWEKRFVDSSRVRFQRQRMPLQAIYLLSPRCDDPPAPRIEHLEMREGLIALVQNTYMNWLLDRQRRAAELDVLSRLVARVPIRRVTPARDPARIGDLCDLILKDAPGLISDQQSVGFVQNH